MLDDVHHHNRVERFERAKLFERPDVQRTLDPLLDPPGEMRRRLDARHREMSGREFQKITGAGADVEQPRSGRQSCRQQRHDLLMEPEAVLVRDRFTGGEVRVHGVFAALVTPDHLLL